MYARQVSGAKQVSVMIDKCRSEGQGGAQGDSQALATVTGWRMVSFLKQGIMEEKQVRQERGSIQAGSFQVKGMQN